MAASRPGLPGFLRRKLHASAEYARRITWPLSAAADFAAWARELLR
jgi:hypothetical protein